MSYYHPPDPDKLLKRAITAHKSEQFGYAETIYQKLLNSFPEHPQLNAYIGHALKAQGKFEPSISAYQLSVTHDPRNPETLNGLGAVYHAQGRYTEAETWYRKAIEIAPGYAEAHNNLGSALQDQAQPDDAELSYRMALHLQPAMTGASINLQNLLFSDNSPAVAIDILEAAYEHNANHPKLLFYLAVLKSLNGDDNEAAMLLSSISAKASADIAALIDSWQYICEHRERQTRLFGYSYHTRAHALEACTVDGMTLEFGVNFGATLRYIANQIDGPVHGFDSFKGIPESWRHETAGSYSTNGTLPDVPENATLHEGWFNDTLPGFLEAHADPVRFVHIDCDIYSSTKTVFDNLADRIVPGTVILFDEYLSNPGWRDDEFKAFQEAATYNGWRYEYLAFCLSGKQAAVRIL
jgi:Flp pilus assembly protein TadD